MMDGLRKSLAFGLGIAALTTDKVKEFVDQAVAKGEITKDEAKSVMDDITSRAEEERRSVRGWIYDQVNKALRDAGAADSTRVTQLEARMAALERRIERLEAGAPSIAAGVCEEAPQVMAE